MSLSIRAQAINGLAETIRSITPANGYVFDLSSSVYVGEVKFGDEAKPPFIAILEPPIVLHKQKYVYNCQQQEYSIDLIVQGFVEKNVTNQFDGTAMGYALLAEVRKAIATEVRDKGLNLTQRNIFGAGRNLVEVKMDHGIVRPADEMSTLSYFWMTMTLDIFEDAINPYMP